MKTRSQREFHLEDDHVEVDVVVGEEEIHSVDLPAESMIPKTTLSKTLRRVEQNAQAAFRSSVIKDAVKELTNIRARNGGRAIYGDFKKVLKKYQNYKFVTRSAIIYRLKCNDTSQLTDAGQVQVVLPESIEIGSSNSVTLMSDITGTDNINNGNGVGDSNSSESTLSTIYPKLGHRNNKKCETITFKNYVGFQI